MLEAIVAESYNGCSDKSLILKELLLESSYGSGVGQTNQASVSSRRNNNSPSFAADFWSNVDQSTECWLWVGKTTYHGYGYFWIPTEFRTQHAHRIAWTLKHGPVPAGLKVLHRCDVRACCNPSHLFLGTQLDNMRDMAAKGRRSPHAHARKGRKFSADHRAALSAAQRARYAKQRKQVA